MQEYFLPNKGELLFHGIEGTGSRFKNEPWG